MAPRKRGLGGKGINTLIEASNTDNGATEIDINKVQPNSKQPRKNFNEDALNELVESIKSLGIIEPLIVNKKSKEGFYEIVAGERRWRAAKLAGIKKVPVIIKDYSDQEVMEIALVENIQREDLNPIEEAEAYNSLIKEYKLTQDQVAEKVSKSRTVITNSIRLLKLDEKVRQMVIEEKLTNGHARALLSIKDKKKQFEVATLIFDSSMSVRETEKYIKKLLNSSNSKKKAKQPQTAMDAIYSKYEERLRESIGSKVSIKSASNGKGKIEIEYYSNDDFERIVEILSK
ncbi:MAG: ParB/RepB/Spo0J family partition protein [Lachnospiraceae bacterium]|nr:ParB/RepB/Spo0J family partition protein [Lachnospiraceae bacterium]